ncbi:MAG TPA: hypothetical protein VMT34_10530 [Aggregatilineales bacterium]|nr:hypothetical protein [Aggregatilineales bacterium]
MNADGTEIQFLVAVFYLAQLAWSPDGQNIVATDGTGIVVMGADGSNRLQLTDKSPNNVNTDPAWTPDSRFITFVSNRDGAQHLYLMNIDGTNVHPLVQSSADQTNRARSPDGSQIAFISRADGHSWPYVMNADGTGKHVLFKADCYSVSWR